MHERGHTSHCELRIENALILQKPIQLSAGENAPGMHLRGDKDTEHQRHHCEVDALPDRHVRRAIARLAPHHRADQAHEGRIRLPSGARGRRRGCVLDEEDAGRGGAINNCKNQKLCTQKSAWDVVGIEQ